MNEQLNPNTQRLSQFLQRYTCAMEYGDIDALAAVLVEAEQDQALERMILEVNESYQQEDQLVVQPADVALVRQFLFETLSAESTFAMEETFMQSTVADNDQINTPSHVDSDSLSEPVEALNAPQSQKLKALPARKVLTQVSPARQAKAQKWYRARRTWLIAAALVVLIGFIAFPSSGVLANQILSLFHVQQFQPVQVSQQDVKTLTSHSIPSLSDLGSVKTQPGSLKIHDNLTEAQAAQMVKFPILLPHSLPQGIQNTPDFGTIGAGYATFTFSSSLAHAYFVKNGYGNVNIPANLDGATFDITTSAGVQISYGQGAVQFVVAEMPSPVLRATGKASLQDMRNFILSLPGLPPQLVAQLRQVNLTGDVVPLLIPSGVASKPVTVHGTMGLLLTSSVSTSIAQIKQFPIGSAVVWQAQGTIYALGGTVSNTDQLVASANTLH